jgi:hypothetical protein
VAHARRLSTHPRKAPRDPPPRPGQAPPRALLLPTAQARAEAGERIDDLLDEIAEIQRLIATSPAETLEDAAVKLRRLGAYIEQGQQAWLLAAALGAVERAAN